MTTAHPILTIMFKNILRTLEDEIFKMFKSVHLASAQKLDVLIKKSVFS